MDVDDLENAETEIDSLLRKCDAVLRGCALSASRRTLMVNRVAALRTAQELIADARTRDAT